MASQKQGRSTTGQQGSGRQSGSDSKAGRPVGSGNSASRGNSGSRGGRQDAPGGGSTNRAGRPSQPPGGPASRGSRPEPPRSSAKDRARPRPGQAAAATLAQDDNWQAGTPRPAASRWLQLTTLILSLAGLGVSIYLTVAHYTSPTILACPTNSFINCGEVTTSSESIVFGIFPVAVLGLAFYVFMVAINSPWAWRFDFSPIRWLRLGGRTATIHWIRLGAVITGIGFVLYLVYAELIEIGKICEYCTVVHIITFVLFALIVFDASFRNGATARR